ncbi:MAG: DUF885 family protein [Bacteroidota bacterium]
MHQYLKFKCLLILSALSAFTIGCSEPEKSSEDISSEINAWFDAKYEEKLQESPLTLTVQGRKDLYDKMDDMSEAAEERQLKWAEASVEELKTTFDYEKLNAEDKLSYDLWVYQYEQMKEDARFRNMNYVYDQMTAIHTQLPNMLINLHRVDSLSDMQNYISRIEGLGRAINQLNERAKRQAELGILPPKFSFEITISQTEALLDGYPFNDSEKNSPLWTDMSKKIEALQTSTKIDAEGANMLKTNAELALIRYFKPAYENLLTWLKTEMSNAEEAPTGVSRHDNGKEFYNYRLKRATTTDLTADEIHEIGLKEVARIHEEMKAIKDKVAFEGSLQEFFQFINSDPRFFYPNTDEGRQAYLDDSKMFLDSITARLPDFFGILPKANLVVRRVESFREQDGAPQHYRQGTPDGSRPGTYYAHLSDMTSMPKSTMEGVAYHEGNPGHHMQRSIAQELESVPKFRTQGGFNAYTEGWGLYAEILAKEMGGYQNPYYDFGRLVNEIWRAIRLVVDTGLHSKGWTEEDGVNYFRENSSISDGAIRAEVRRYLVIPGQATGYKIGMLKIQELRARAEAQLGKNFDIKDFHDTILGGGAMPLSILEKHVDRWIDVQKQL